MDWKKIGKKLLFPPVWLMVLLVILSTAALVTVFVMGWSETIAAYLLYVLAFYTLSVVCVFCWLVLPKQYQSIKQKLLANPLSHRYLTDRVFRSTISMYASLTVNMLYVGINVWFWYQFHSWWFMVLAVYYVLMAVMRFLLVRFVRGNEVGISMLEEWKRSRLCACFLLLINLSLSGAVLMIVYQNRGYDYPGIMIYVMALYTFYATTHAIVDIVKYRKMGSPIMTTAKVVSLSAALVSMLNLETAMFAQFGAEMSPENQRLMIILTGAGISVVVVTLSVLLIVIATKETGRMKNGQ